MAVRVERWIYKPYIQSTVQYGKDGWIGSIAATDTIAYDIKLVGSYKDIEDFIFNNIDRTDGLKTTILGKEFDAILELSTKQIDNAIYELNVLALYNATVDVSNYESWFLTLEQIKKDMYDLNTDGIITNIEFKLTSTIQRFIVDTPAYLKQLQASQIISTSQTIEVYWDGSEYGNGWVNKMITEGLVEVNTHTYMYSDISIEMIAPNKWLGTFNVYIGS
jgi:hypothetical protein